jgi:hypothetical protein
MYKGNFACTAGTVDVFMGRAGNGRVEDEITIYVVQLLNCCGALKLA